MGNLLLIQGIVALVCFLVYHRCFRRRGGPSLPPGPKPLPLIGNIRDLPPAGVPEFQHWLKHKEIYGPISSVTVLGQSIVLLHDKQAAHDLLDKESKKCSGRPMMEFAYKWCGFGKFIVSRQFDDTFRLHRKLMHQGLGSRAAVARYNDVLEVEVRRFLLRTLNEPHKVVEHFQTEASAIILKIAYGYTAEPKMDPLVRLIQNMLHNWRAAFVPMSWMVDIVPALKYLPDGFPGTGFKETARRWQAINMAVVNTPYDFVRRQMANDSHHPSYVSNMVQQYSTEERKLDHEVEEAIKWTAGALYGAGADTTVSTLSSFILAMVMFPEVQRKAQEEIDRMVGTDCLPRFQDREKLPYVESVIKEALRWCPIGPLSMPHTTDEDVIYRGHLIPKGTFVMPSIWWFLHDPQVYSNPDAFDPERYLEPRKEPEPREAAFGFGRRICPGRELADSTLFLTIAQVLAVFNISKAVDEQGAEIEAKLEHVPGAICHPAAFPYRIAPRSAKKADLIRSIEVEHPWKESDANRLEGDIIKGYM